MSQAEIIIDGRQIGSGAPPYLIAELSGNHNGKLERALRLVEIAKECGADAVKLQTYTAETITIDHDGSDFQIRGGLWDGHSLHDLYRMASTPWEWHAALFQKAYDVGITIFSSPFDTTAIDFLEELGAPAYKIASFECVDLPLINYAAATGKPLILSTGMSTLAEIDEAQSCIPGKNGKALLYCVSGYPAPIEDINLRTMQALAASFDCPVGLSDHSAGTAVSTAAAALGAAIIERHLTISRADGGPDSAFSLEPDEFKRLSADCRTAWQSLGKVHFGPKPSERPNQKFRRSLYIVADVAAGEALTSANIRSIRPGYGLAPKFLPIVLGRKASRDLRRGTALDWTMIAG